MLHGKVLRHPLERFCASSHRLERSSFSLIVCRLICWVSQGSTRWTNNSLTRISHQLRKRWLVTHMHDDVLQWKEKTMFWRARIRWFWILSHTTIVRISRSTQVIPASALARQYSCQQWIFARVKLHGIERRIRSMMIILSHSNLASIIPLIRIGYLSIFPPTELWTCFIKVWFLRINSGYDISTFWRCIQPLP